MGAHKQINRSKFRGGVYFSSFANPRKATEQDLLSFLKKNHFDLLKILHSPGLCQTLYRFFRAKMSQKISPETFEELAGILLELPIKSLKTADAIFCFLTVVNCLIHQDKQFYTGLGYPLLKKKDETISHLFLTMPECFTLERDFLGKEGRQLVIRRITNPDDCFHVPDWLIRAIKAKAPGREINLES